MFVHLKDNKTTISTKLLNDFDPKLHDKLNNNVYCVSRDCCKNLNVTSTQLVAAMSRRFIWRLEWIVSKSANCW